MPQAAHGRECAKADKECMRPLYKMYKELKDVIDRLEAGGSPRRFVRIGGGGGDAARLQRRSILFFLFYFLVFFFFFPLLILQANARHFRPHTRNC
jgi:hypothetical protein